MANRNTLIGAVQELSDRVGVSLDRINATLGGMENCRVPQAAYSDPEREEVIIRYTVGKGSFSSQAKYSVLIMDMFDMDGNPDGYHHGVWQPVVKPEDLYTAPNPPKGPLNEAKGPIEQWQPRAYTKAIWSFGDGSSITAVGPAQLYLVEYGDKSNIFLVSVSAIMTNGTGRYEGAKAIKTALGSTFVPKGVNMFDLKPGQEFGAVTVETFRVVRSEFL